MQTRILNNAGLLLLAIVFSTGLIFAFIELPRLLDDLLQNQLGFPQFDQGGGELNAIKTEMFIQGLHLRWIGYGSLLLILLLIAFGYSTRRSGLALAGAVGLFIPVFGQFAMSMFFLAGLGFLRVGWLPLLEVTSFDLLDLGKVIYVPYWILIWFFGLFQWNAHTFLTYFFMGSGAFLFTWGVLVWFKARYNRQKVATSWIYRISRHPQYLGWIIWSYGFILFTPFINQMKKSWTVPSSLPWLLMTMAIIGICMLEELRMMEITGGEYQKYRSSSPFMFPVPRWLNHILTAPVRLVVREGFPTRRIQVMWITLIYTGILILLSLFWVDFNNEQSQVKTPEASDTELSEVIQELHQAGDNRKGVWTLIREIPEFGIAGMDSLQVLASHPNPIIREFSNQLLGENGILDAEDLFIKNMYDSVRRVRSAAIISAGRIRSERAVDSLIRMVVNPRMENNFFHIFGALGSIGDRKAIPCLAECLNAPTLYERIFALNAIMQIDPVTGIEYAIAALEDEDEQVRQNAVMHCILTGDPSVIEPLEAMYGDENFEVRFYAKQGVKRIKKDNFIE